LLDDYLAHDLMGEQRERFVAHLAVCQDCRRVVTEQQRIDALLIETSPPVPAGLLKRVERRMRRAQRRRIAAAAMALAACVAVVLLLGDRFRRPIDPKPQIARSQPESPMPEPLRPADQVRVRFPSDSGVFAVPLDTGSPNVTFLQVFNDLRTVRPLVADPPSERNDS
jgi:hypothetical protein